MMQYLRKIRTSQRNIYRTLSRNFTSFVIAMTEKKNPGTRRKMGKGATAKPKSATTKLRAVKKPKKSKAMYA